ncbi:46498_t:CDS:2 [Gigaspora margarita]|uniref:46498_t:CDS:1 n=1 Tax=Gigaspora margarita TaxID=4874 RepID=A0ABN7VBJ6_GIGMA|nr:46498_t:CDS:2 [Gigaspora margarita]
MSKVLLPKPEFKKIIFGSTSEVRRSWWKSHIRGLLVNEIVIKKCFYEKIWQRRYKEANQWEKDNGITAKDKHKKRRHEDSLVNNGVKDDQYQKREEVIERLFVQGVEDRVVNGVVPFLFGL